MRKSVLFALAAAFLLVAGCGLVGSDPDFYPNSVGSSWRYDAAMTISPADADTFWTQVTHLHVTGTAALGAGGTAAVFVSTDSTRQRVPWDTTIVTTDTSWVLKTAGWVLDFDGPNDDKPDTMLALPLEPGKTWPVFARADTSVWATVIRKEDAVVPAGTFKDCWVIEFAYTAPGGNYKLTHWYADGVGWVRGWSQFTSGGYTGTTEQRLTGYDVK
jgi:hypothetical protein